MRRSLSPGRAWLAAALLCALPLPAAAQASAAPGPGAVAVTFGQGRLDLEANEAPLGDVLRAIAREADFQLALSEPLEATGTWSFSDVPLESGLLRLLDDRSSLMLYGPGESAGAWVLTEVRVLGDDGDDGSPKEAPASWLSRDEGGDPAVRAGMDGPPEARRQAVRSLATRPGVEDSLQLVGFVRDQDPVVRRIAAIGLGRIAVPDSRTALHVALADEDALVRRRAAESLGRIGGVEAIEPLGRALLEDPDPDVRRTAAFALGRLKDGAAAETLVTAQSDGDPSVRRAATTALVRLEQVGYRAEE